MGEMTKKEKLDDKLWSLTVWLTGAGVPYDNKYDAKRLLPNNPKGYEKLTEYRRLKEEYDSMED